MKHIQTVSQHLTLEVGYASDMRPAGLARAITEALEQGGVLDEARIVYIKAEAPGERFFAFDMWVPEPEVVEEPPMVPQKDDGNGDDLRSPNV